MATAPHTRRKVAQSSASKSRAFLANAAHFCMCFSRGARAFGEKIYRKHARFSSHKFLIIAGDGPAHAAQARKIFRAKIARFSWRTPTERAHFCVYFARGARELSAKSAEKIRKFRCKHCASSAATDPTRGATPPNFPRRICMLLGRARAFFHLFCARRACVRRKLC